MYGNDKPTTTLPPGLARVNGNVHAVVYLSAVWFPAVPAECLFFDWAPRLRFPTHLIVLHWFRGSETVQRDTRFKRPPQQASAYG